jgi:pentapeptide MXKDX repeat protein
VLTCFAHSAAPSVPPHGSLAPGLPGGQPGASHESENERNKPSLQIAPRCDGHAFAIANLWRSHSMKKSRLMLPLTAATLAFGIALAPAAFAQDNMKKDKMEKSSMSKDKGMKKDSMSKDKMSKDKMKK